jgi:hypothetical protein
MKLMWNFTHSEIERVGLLANDTKKLIEYKLAVDEKANNNVLYSFAAKIWTNSIIRRSILISYTVILLVLCS